MALKEIVASEPNQRPKKFGRAVDLMKSGVNPPNNTADKCS
jgi:hypothetical protein